MFRIMSATQSDPAALAWARLLRAHKRALSVIESDLKAAELPPLPWYDVLLELDRAGEAGLRPFELERQLVLPQYGLSRLLDRIEKAGYIERRPCEQDGRGHELAITKAGRDTRRRMWTVYSNAIDQAVGAHLSDAEATRLAKLLDKLI